MNASDRDSVPLTCCENGSDPGDLIPREWLRKPLWLRLTLGTAGILLVALGMVGWLMPVIPGFVLVPFGVLLIAATSKWLAKRLNRLERRLPLRTRKFIHHPVHWVEARLPGDWTRKARRPRRSRKKLCPAPAAPVTKDDQTIS